MVKRILFAVIAVFITWSVFEIIIHFIILIDTYQATHYQWRMMGEMKSRLLLFIGLIAAACFVCISFEGLERIFVKEVRADSS